MVSRSQPNTESLLTVEDHMMLDGVMIAHLKARIEALEGALRPFSQFADRFGDTAREDDWQITNNPSGTGNLTMGDCRGARAILQPKAGS